MKQYIFHKDLSKFQNSVVIILINTLCCLLNETYHNDLLESHGNKSNEILLEEISLNTKTYE